MDGAREVLVSLAPTVTEKGNEKGGAGKERGEVLSWTGPFLFRALRVLHSGS